MQETIDAYIKAHREEMLACWEELVNLEGKSGELDAMETLAKRLGELFAEAGVSCELRKGHAEAPSVLIGEIGSDRPGKPILLSGHYDTVFAKGAFGPNPFRIDDEGHAHGPGCLDMKGGIVMALYVVKALEKSGFWDRPIRIAFCGDEENGAHHMDSAKILREAARGCVCALNMETAPISNALCVGRKGAMLGSFIAHGVSAHSGNNFEAGRNAIKEAAHKILAIEALTDLSLGTHMNVALVSGGTMWNAVPDRCEVTYSGRFSLNSEIRRVREAIDQLMTTHDVEGTTIEYHPAGEGPVFEQTEQNMALWKFCSDTARELGMGDMGHVFLGGGSDAMQIALENVPTLCSCGVAGEWNHTEREYAVVETLFSRTKLWCEVIRRLDQMKL